MAVFNINWKQYQPSTKGLVQGVSSSPPPIPPAPVVSQPQLGNVTPPSQSQVPTRGPIFSGGTLSDVFDTLMSPLYGYSGFLKGGYAERQRQKQTGEAQQGGGGPFASGKNIINRFKESFKGIIPGIKNRVMPSRAEGDVNPAQELGIKSPLGQEAYNTALTFTAPSLPIGKLLNLGGKVAKFIPGAEKVAEVLGKVGGKVDKFAKETPFVYNAIEKFNPYFRNPEMGKMVETAQRSTQFRLNQLFNTLKDVTKKLSPEEQAAVGSMVENKVVKTGPLGEVARQMVALSNKIGQEAVDAGLMTVETFNKYKGKYMGHVFEKYLNKTGEWAGKVKDVPGLIGTKTRKGIEGYVQQFAPGQFYRLGNTIKDLETAKLYKGIAERFGVDAIKGVGKAAARKIPEGMVYGRDVIRASRNAVTNSRVAKYFLNKAVPKEVADYLGRVRNVNPVTMYDKALGAWKAGKTIWNPAYHIRNLLSNQILSDMSTGRGIVRTAYDYVQSVRSYFGKGNQMFVKAAEDAGLIKNSNFNGALNEFLDAAGLAQKNGLERTAELPRTFQNVTEETAKLNVFRSWIERFADDANKTVDEVLKDPQAVEKAVAKAQEAIFSPYRISPSERQLMSRLVPFYSFARQALPFTAKTLIEHPDRIAKYGKAKQVVENLSQGPSEGERPDYYQGQIRLPTKDKEGRDTYLDPTYLYPFGNFADTGFERGKLPFGLSIRPDIMELVQQTTGRDAYFDRPFATSNIPARNIKQRVAHGVETAAPTFFNNLVNKLIPSIKGETDKAGRSRNIIQGILDSVLGIKTSNISPEEMRLRGSKQDIKKLRSIQQEEQDILKDRNIPASEKKKLLQDLRSVYQKQ